jgi:hypothetical protein
MMGIRTRGLLGGLIGCASSLLIASVAQAAWPDSEMILLALERQEVRTEASGANDPAPLRKKVTKPAVPAASITISCGNGKQFKLSVDGGTCEVLTDPNNNSVIGGQCGGTSGNYAIGACAVGCSQTGGNGSCTPVN